MVLTLVWTAHRVRLRIVERHQSEIQQKVIQAGTELRQLSHGLHQLNGTFAFDTAPGRGTTITAEIPFR